MSYRLISFDVYSALANIEGSLIPELTKEIGSNKLDTTAFFSDVAYPAVGLFIA